MSDVLRMQLDIQNNLEKDLEKSTKKMKGFNSLIEDAGDKFVNMGKTITKSVGGALKAVGRIISTIIPGFAALFSVATILDAVRGVLEMNKSLTQLSHRMGHGAQGARVLQQTVFEVNAELGIGVDKTQELVTVLTTMRVPLDMMKDMTRTVGLFAELTGISADRAAELGGNLVTIGRMGQEAVDGIMASMVGVQRAIGLTESEMNSLSDTIVGSTQMLNQMGKSAGDIEKYNRGVVKLAAAFASVGVEAGKVLSIMDDLLDPSEVEKHAFLLSQLGVSLGDAFEGNIDPAQLVSGFKDLGQTLQGMTGPAAAAMAEQLNMSVRDLRQMGELGEDELAKVAEAMADGASGADAMAAAFNEEATGLQNFERTMEKIKGFIGETAVKFMPAIEKLFEWVSEHAETFMGYVSKGIEWFMKLPNMIKMAIPLLIGGIILFFKLMRRRFATTATEAGKSLETGVTEGITQGSRKGALAMKKEFASAKEIDLRVRTEQGAGFKSMTADAELLETRARGMEGFFGNVMRKTAGMHRNLAYSTKPIALLESKSKAMAETHAQTYELAKNQASQVKAAFELREQEYTNEQVRLANRIKYLQDHGDTESSQVKHLQKLHDELNKKKLSADSRLANATQASIRREQRTMKAMSNDMLLDLALEKKARQDNLESSIKGISKRHEASQKETDALNLALEDLKNRRGDMNLLEFQKTEKEINAALLEQGDIRSQLATQKEQEISEAGHLKKEYEEINKILSEDRGISEISEAAKSLSQEGGHFSKFITQAGRNLRLSVTQTAASFVEGARNAAGAFADRFRKENVGATLRGGARTVGRGAAGAAKGAAGGLARGLGGLLKMAGPIALIAGLLQNMEPIQELMAKVMEKIKEPMQKIAEMLMPLIQGLFSKLMPIIEDLIKAIMPLIEGIVNKLAPIIVRLVSALGPLIRTLVQALGPVLESLFAALMPLIEMLLPPLIWALGALIEVFGKGISIWGNLLKFMMELPERITHALPKFLGGGGGEGRFRAGAELQANAFYKIADSVASMGDQLSEAGRVMRQTAFDPADPDTQSMFTESFAEGTVQGSERSEIRRTWEPAQLRALKDGIEQEQAMTEVTSGTANSEERIADNTQRLYDQREQQHADEMARMQLEIEEANRRHEEMMAANEELRRVINNRGGISASF